MKNNVCSALSTRGHGFLWREVAAQLIFLTYVSSSEISEKDGKIDLNFHTIVKNPFLLGR